MDLTLTILSMNNNKIKFLSLKFTPYEQYLTISINTGQRCLIYIRKNLYNRSSAYDNIAWNSNM